MGGQTLAPAPLGIRCSPVPGEDRVLWRLHLDSRLPLLLARHSSISGRKRPRVAWPLCLRSSSAGLWSCSPTCLPLAFMRRTGEAVLRAARWPALAPGSSGPQSVGEKASPPLVPLNVPVESGRTHKLAASQCSKSSLDFEHFPSSARKAAWSWDPRVRIGPGAQDATEKSTLSRRVSPWSREAPRLRVPPLVTSCSLRASCLSRPWTSPQDHVARQGRRAALDRPSRPADGPSVFPAEGPAVGGTPSSPSPLSRSVSAVLLRKHRVGSWGHFPAHLGLRGHWEEVAISQLLGRVCGSTQAPKGPCTSLAIAVKRSCLQRGPGGKEFAGRAPQVVGKEGEWEEESGPGALTVAWCKPSLALPGEVEAEGLVPRSSASYQGGLGSALLTVSSSHPSLPHPPVMGRQGQELHPGGAACSTGPGELGLGRRLVLFEGPHLAPA